MFQRHPIQHTSTMFITTNLQNKQPIFAESAAARIAVETLYAKQEMRPFYLFGFVIMPDHCHFLLQLPAGGSISKLMNAYKRSVSFALGSGPIWQSRFHLLVPNNAVQV